MAKKGKSFKRMTDEEKLAIQAYLKNHSQLDTAKKFKRSTGTINRIFKEMQKIENMSEEEAKEKKVQDTFFFLKEIKNYNDTHAQQVKQSIFDAMRDDTMSEILKRFKHLLMNDEVCVATALDKGIDPFVRAIEMISRQNVNIATYEHKKLELEIRKLELEIKKEQLQIQKNKAQGLNDELDNEEELETDVEKSLMNVLDIVVKEMSEENFDFNSLLEPDSFKELPKSQQDIEEEELNNV